MKLPNWRENGMFVYESVPGTAVEHFVAEDWGVEFLVESAEDVQITGSVRR